MGAEVSLCAIDLAKLKTKKYIFSKQVKGTPKYHEGGVGYV